MNKFLSLLVTLIVLIFGVLIYQHMNPSTTPDYALYYPEPHEIKPFKMLNHQGDVFDNEALLNKWSWIFLGYTSCPDVCPTTLQTLNFIYDELQAISHNNQVVLVSVDPARDKQEKLSLYIHYFHQDFIAASADHEVLFPFARNLGMIYGITTPEDAVKQNHSYLVDHSASIALIDPSGKLTAIFKPEHTPGQVPSINSKKLVADFAKIVALY